MNKIPFIKAFVSVGVLAAVGFAEAYTLVADADLPIRRVVNQADSPANAIVILSAGTKGIVVGCEDYKSDIAIRVRTETGEFGYVSDGAFHLKREGVAKYLFSDSDRIVWSCHGFYNTRKVG